jgi:hypothetical protein
MGKSGVNSSRENEVEKSILFDVSQTLKDASINDRLFESVELDVTVNRIPKCTAA